MSQEKMQMQKENSILEKIFSNKIVLMFIIVALCGPYMLTRGIGAIKQLYEFITTVVAWCVVLLYARYGKWTLQAKWISVFIGWTFVTTFFLSQNTKSFYQLFIPIMALVFLIELAFQYKKCELLDATVIFRAYIYLNFVMILVSPQGMLGNESWWFLGYRNIQSWTLLPIATLLIMRALWKFGKVNWITWLDLAVIFMTLIIIKSATTWIGTFVYVVIAGIAWICRKKRISMPRIINLFDGLIATILFFGGIVVFHVEKIFEPFIVNVLHRDVTFTGRRWIWDQVLNYLKTRGLFGTGYLTVKDFRKIFAGGVFRYAHPHNYVLSVILQGGIILLIIVGVALVISAVCLWKNRDSLMVNLFLALLLSMVLMGLTESLSVYLCPLFYPMVTMSMHAEKMKHIVK